MAQPPQTTIHDMEQLLDAMNDPTMDTEQHLLHISNIGKINDMLQTLYKNPQYIKIKRENGPSLKEMDNSTTNIQKRMSENLDRLQVWKTTYTKTRRQEEATSIFTDIKSKHNALRKEITRHSDYFTKESPSTSHTPLP